MASYDKAKGTEDLFLPGCHTAAQHKTDAFAIYMHRMTDPLIARTFLWYWTWVFILLYEKFRIKDIKMSIWFIRNVKMSQTWLKYCRYGVKLYPINQSINQTDLCQ